MVTCGSERVNNPKMTTDKIRAVSEVLLWGILDHLKPKSSLPTVITFKHANFNFVIKIEDAQEMIVGPSTWRGMILKSATFRMRIVLGMVLKLTFLSR